MRVFLLCQSNSAIMFSVQLTLITLLLSKMSVRLSVKRVHCDKAKETSAKILTRYKMSIHLVMRHEERLVEDDPLHVDLWAKLCPIFNRFSLVPPFSFHRFDLFLFDLQSSSLITSPPTSLGSLLFSYNATLSTLLDKYAIVIANKSSKRSIKSNP